MTATRPAPLAKLTFTLPEIPAPPDGFSVTGLLVQTERPVWRNRFPLDQPYLALSELLGEGTARAALYAMAEDAGGTDVAAEYDADSGEWLPWGDAP